VPPTRTRLSLSVRVSLAVTQHVDLTLALMNAFDRNYGIHGCGVDAPGPVSSHA
jgi:hypothetical protein